MRAPKLTPVVLFKFVFEFIDYCYFFAMAPLSVNILAALALW